MFLAHTYKCFVGTHQCAFNVSDRRQINKESVAVTVMLLAADNSC